MRSFPRLILTGLGCVAIAVVMTYWLMRDDEAGGSDPGTPTPRGISPVMEEPPYPSPTVATFPDPTAPAGSPDRVFVDPQTFDSLILAATAQFTDKVRDEGSLREYREVIAHRAERAKSQLRKQLDGLHLGQSPSLEEALGALWIYRQLAFVALYEGNHDEATSWLERSLEMARTPGVPTIGPGAHDGLAGHQRPATGRAG